MHWYEQAMQSLEEDLEDGHISYEEFRKEMRELNAELQQAKQEAAQNAYDNY